jgi:hypothetical protein
MLWSRYNLVQEARRRSPAMFHPPADSVPILLDKNRRYISKSQSKRPLKPSCALSCAAEVTHPGRSRVRTVAAATHVGAMVLSTLVLVGFVVAEAINGITLPDPRVLLTASEDEVRSRMGAFLEDMRAFGSNYATMSGILGVTWIAATARLVRLLDYDPRLSLISRTVSNAGTELSFFLLSSAVTLVGFSLAGSVMFGGEFSAFLSPGKALLTLMGGVSGRFHILRGRVDWDLPTYMLRVS